MQIQKVKPEPHGRLKVDVDQNMLLGELVGSIGRSGFDRHWFNFFDQLVGISQCTVFACAKNAQARVVVAQSHNSQLNDAAHALAIEYLQSLPSDNPYLGKYLVWNAHENAICYRRVGAKVRNYNFRSRFYEEQNLLHHLILPYRENGQTFLTILFRSSAMSAFTPEETAEASFYRDLAISLLKRHLELSDIESPVAMSNDERNRWVREVLMRWNLTPREAEVCAMKLVGYTSLGIGLCLGISTNTVSTHIRRAYCKLGITSQSELFCRCFDTLIGGRVTAFSSQQAQGAG